MQYHHITQSSNSKTTLTIQLAAVFVLLFCITFYVYAASQPQAIATSNTQNNYLPFNQAKQFVVPAPKAAVDDHMWIQIAADFSLPHYVQTAEVTEQINWYIKHKNYFYQLTKNAEPYIFYIHQQVSHRKLPGELVLLPLIESAYDPFAYSQVGAAGLWQIMPATGRNFGLKKNYWIDERRDIKRSTDAALNYLTYLDNFFDHNWLLAIAAYDSGEGTVQKAVRRNHNNGKGKEFWDLHLPKETKSYVPRLLAVSAIIRDPEKYGITLPPIPNQPYFEEVEIGHKIRLKQAAKLAGMKLDKLYALNPGYSHWSTGPKGPFLLLLPPDKVAGFQQALKQSSNS